MNTWLVPAIVAALSGSVVVAIVFTYLDLSERQPGMRRWSLAWVFYTIRLVFDLLEAWLLPGNRVLLGGSLLFALVAGLLLLNGSVELMGRRAPHWPRWTGAAVAIWIVVATLAGIDHTLLSAPVFFVLGVANIAAGVAWLRSGLDAGPWPKVTAGAFIVWGLHKMDYPVLRVVAWFAPIGFLLSALLELIVALGALLAYFQSTRRQLEESEASLAFFADNALDVIFRTRIKPVFAMEYISPAIERLVGYPPSHFLERPDAAVELVHPDDRATVMAAVAGDVIEGPWLCRWLHRDGHVVWTEQQLVALTDAGGVVTRVDGIARDVTDRVLAERAARQSELRYRSLFERNASVMMLLDPENAAIVDVNDAAVKYYGWSREQLQSMRISDINTLSSDELAQEMAAAHVGRRSHFFFRHRRAGGDIRDVEVYSGPVPIEGRDFLFSIVHDITDRREMLHDLAESEERYVALFRDSLSPMLIIDPADARIVDANAAAAELYGRSAGELTALTIGDLSIDTMEMITNEIGTTIERGGQLGQYRHRCADGSIHDVEVYSTPVISNGRTLLYTIVHDVTQRAQAERELAVYRQQLEEIVAQRTEELTRSNAALERASQAKDEYLANMSHELRTPLNSVIGFSSVLQRGMAGDLNEEQARQVGMINTAGHHLLGVVDGILDLARIEAGRIEAEAESTDVSALCAQVVKGAEPLATERGIQLDHDIPEGIVAITDPTLLEQIIWNLLGNGIKFTDEGNVRLSLTASDSSFSIVVSDTGRGVGAQDRERVFETFIRLEDAEGTRTEGSGLGLPITKRLVRVLGGTIALESELGHGSTFSVTIPR